MWAEMWGVALSWSQHDGCSVRWIKRSEQLGPVPSGKKRENTESDLSHSSDGCSDVTCLKTGSFIFTCVSERWHPPLTHPLILWLTRLIQGEGKHEKSNMAAARVTRPWCREMPQNRSGCALAQGEGAAIVRRCGATEAQTLMCSIGRRVLCSSIKGVSGSLKVKNDLDERTFCWSLSREAVINESQASFKIYWCHLLIKTYIHQVIL